MNIPIEKEKNKVVAKDVDKGAVVVDDDAGTSGEKKVGDDAKMESADESPEDDSQTKNKKKRAQKRRSLRTTTTTSRIKLEAIISATEATKSTRWRQQTTRREMILTYN